MTPSQQAKKAGLKGLSQLCEITGQSAQTLNNWSKHKPRLFKCVLAGCVSLTNDNATQAYTVRFVNGRPIVENNN